MQRPESGGFVRHGLVENARDRLAEPLPDEKFNEIWGHHGKWNEDGEEERQSLGECVSAPSETEDDGRSRWTDPWSQLQPSLRRRQMWLRGRATLSYIVVQICL